MSGQPQKMLAFFLPDFASDSVSLPRFDNLRNVSDKTADNERIP